MASTAARSSLGGTVVIALLEAHRAGLLAPRHWLRNLVAGVIVGVVALPLAMAFAIASGARPEQGIYTAIIGGALVSALGGCRAQIAGPTGAFIAILAGITARYGVSGLQLATFMAGGILLLMGIARMGAVIRFIPAPVIVGFTAGIGVIIFVGQLRDFFGLPAVQGLHFHERAWQLARHAAQFDGPTTLIGGTALGLVLLVPKVPGLARVPGPLVAMVAATLLQAWWGAPSVATVGSTFGALPAGLPAFAMPELSADHIIPLIGPAFAIAMLGAIESLLCAVVADGMAGTRHDPNQELMGQGLANLMTPLFGGFAATGAIARTATSLRNGANSPLAGLVHAALLLGVLLFLAPLASHIPLAALAAILFVVAWNMSEVPHAAHLLATAPSFDRVILLVTFALTVFADLVVAVNVGVTLSVLHFLRRMSESVEAHPVDEPSLQAQLEQLGLAHLPPGVVVYEIAGPLFFGAVENLERVLLQAQLDPDTLILRLHGMPFIDATGLETLARVTAKLHARGVKVLLCEANPRVQAKLQRAGLLENAGADCYHATFAAAVQVAADQPR